MDMKLNRSKYWNDINWWCWEEYLVLKNVKVTEKAGQLGNS